MQRGLWGKEGLGQYITMCVEFQNCQKKNLQGDAILSSAQHGNPTSGEFLLSSVSCEPL